MNLHLPYPSCQPKPPGEANERRSASGKSPHFLISVNRLSPVRAVIELPSPRLR